MALWLVRSNYLNFILMRKRIRRLSRISKYVLYKETLVKTKEDIWYFLCSFVDLALIAFFQKKKRV